jgi:hypothetical protein
MANYAGFCSGYAYGINVARLRSTMVRDYKQTQLFTLECEIHH